MLMNAANAKLAALPLAISNPRIIFEFFSIAAVPGRLHGFDTSLPLSACTNTSIEFHTWSSAAQFEISSLTLADGTSTFSPEVSKLKYFLGIALLACTLCCASSSETTIRAS